MRTSLGLILRSVLRPPRAPRLDTPPLLEMANGYKLLIGKHIQPHKMRKGKSGEIARKR